MRREDMQSLTGGILAAYEARAAVPGQLRKDGERTRAAARRGLSELHGEHKTLAREQRNRLAGARAELVRAGERQRSEAHAQMGAVAADHAGARAAWLGMAATLQAKRSGGAQPPLPSEMPGPKPRGAPSQGPSGRRRTAHHGRAGG